MSDCCSSSACDKDVAPKKYPCPGNGKSNTGVSIATIFHHLKKPWQRQLTEPAYYFCNDPACDVVYYDQGGSIIKQSELRTVVGIKQQSENSMICYCFDVTVKDAMTNPAAKQFVLKKTKERICACDIRNPSGRCCLKDFPKA